MSQLENLESNGVFTIELYDDKKVAQIRENCDLWFSYDLSKSDLIELISELQTIADQMN